MLARRHVDDHELVRDLLFRQCDEDPTRESREWIVVQLDSHETFPQEVAYQVAKYLGCAGSQSLLRLAVRERQSRASSSRMVWLSVDCETPSLAAALVKLCSAPTVKWKGLASAPVPVIASLRGSGFLLITKVADDKVVVVQPNLPRPAQMMRAEFETVWDGRLVVMTRRGSDVNSRGTLDPGPHQHPSASARLGAEHLPILRVACS